jgi:hypothetical protein
MRKRRRMMRRITSALLVAALLAVLTASSAVPAFALVPSDPETYDTHVGYGEQENNQQGDDHLEERVLCDSPGFAYVDKTGGYPYEIYWFPCGLGH